MAVSIDQAASEFKASIDAFVEAYKAKHEREPNHYPLAFLEDNAGLWNEFMLDFHLTGTV